MWRSLLSNAGSILIALLFAVIVWIVATNEENPVREGLFPGAIPITFENKSQDLILSGPSAVTARVRVRAAASTWDALSASNFQVDADLAGAGTGDLSIPLVAKSLDSRLRILSVDPPSVNVRLEKIRQVPVAVRVRVLDEPPLGYEVKPIEVTPTSVTVTGPQGEIEKVNDATVEIALRGAKTAVDREASVSLHDAQGNQIQNLRVEPSTVKVHIPVEQRVGYKDAAVKAIIQGTVASGYWVSDISVDPATVTLIGAPESLNGLGGFVETEPLEVAGARESITRRVRLRLPAGVSVLNANDVMLRVAVEPVLSGLTVPRRVTIPDTCPLYTSVSPDTVEVILSGPLPILQTLTAENVRIVVDEPRCVPGSYQTQLRAMDVPDKISVESIVPATAEVNVQVDKP